MEKRTFIAAVVMAMVAMTVALVWWPHPARVAIGPGLPGRPSPALPGAVTPAAVPFASTGQASPPVPVETNPPGAVVPSASPRIVSAGVAASPASQMPSPRTAVANVVPTTQEALADLDKTQHMIHDYHTLMGENPVGTNAEIMKALMGGNPRQAVLGPFDGQQLNAQGELVDKWGTPYFFHQLSGDHMEIHSAGPDKIMGTADDLILK